MGVGGGRGGGGATQSVRGNYKSIMGINLAVLEGIHQFLSCICIINGMLPAFQVLFRMVNSAIFQCIILNNTADFMRCVQAYIYIIKIKIRSSCEIEYFVETHLRKLCVILRSRVLRVVCPHEGYRSATLLGTTVQLSGSTGWC